MATPKDDSQVPTTYFSFFLSTIFVDLSLTKTMPSCLVSAPLSPTSSPLVFHQKGYNFLSSIKCCEDTVGTARVKYENNGSATFPEKNLVDRSTIRLPWPPPRPRRIILVRHGQSEGNVDESVYTRVADPKIGLTQKGIVEAEACGRRIREMIKKDQADDWKVYFYVSPYRRTLETLRNVAKAFGRSRIAGVREEARLREQDFGNFQDREQMKIDKSLRAIYGRFFYRFPNGESAADVYDRITGFRETLRADIDIGRFQPPGEQSPNMNLVIVSHGLTLRVFLMRWYKWTVEQFQGLNNMGNGNTVVMERGAGGRYSLLVHHTEEELREFGLTDEMLIDQEWQKVAKPGEVNYHCPMTGPSFFTHFGDDPRRE
ncbi:phosphoglycerate mutase-like protein AT74H [Actinidia eriantha]|uniref:phosphoglycerate mutase-like protein AT74H n=1 Tax=Actinidia eriantha TaxID=165200 RepID=UPI002587827E|nr:phosphoglycerate mutase-like protein AT74H [Actinidia eriantha]